MSKVWVTGGTGMVGRALVPALLKAGHTVTVLSRHPQQAAKVLPSACMVVAGDPMELGEWSKALCGHDAVIHLAGQNVADKRWTTEFKKTLEDSRIISTGNLTQAMLACDSPPRVFLGASAIGWYGDTGDEPVDESAPPSNDFFGSLCERWEESSAPLQGKVRRVLVRTGVVLKAGQGALAKLDQPIRWGIGGPLAGGHFFMSWIHLEDLVRLFLWALENPHVSGPINATSPEPVRNGEMVRQIARRLKRPAFFPVPYFVLRLAVGEFARFLCASQRVLPNRALEGGFVFRYPSIASALDAEYPVV